MDKPKYTRIKPISWKTEMKSENNEKHYPTLSLSIRDIPEIKGWKVDETYNVSLELREVSMSDSRHGHGGATFEILGYHIDEDQADDEEDEDEDSDEDDSDEDDSEDEDESDDDDEDEDEED